MFGIGGILLLWKLIKYEWVEVRLFPLSLKTTTEYSSIHKSEVCPKLD